MLNFISADALFPVRYSKIPHFLWRSEFLTHLVSFQALPYVSAAKTAKFAQSGYKKMDVSHSGCGACP